MNNYTYDAPKPVSAIKKVFKALGAVIKAVIYIGGLLIGLAAGAMTGGLAGGIIAGVAGQTSNAALFATIGAISVGLFGAYRGFRAGQKYPLLVASGYYIAGLIIAIAVIKPDLSTSPWPILIGIGIVLALVSGIAQMAFGITLASLAIALNEVSGSPAPVQNWVRIPGDNHSGSSFHDPTPIPAYDPTTEVYNNIQPHDAYRPDHTL